MGLIWTGKKDFSTFFVITKIFAKNVCPRRRWLRWHTVNYFNFEKWKTQYKFFFTFFEIACPRSRTRQWIRGHRRQILKAFHWLLRNILPNKTLRSIRDVVDYAETHNSYFVIEYLRENEKVRETVSPAHVRCTKSDLMYSVIGKQSWAYATFAATIQEADTLPTNSVSKLNFDSNGQHL